MGTLREYIRKQSGTFSAKDILDGYLPVKPTIKLDSVKCQLERLVEKGELTKMKNGKNVTYSPVNLLVGYLFDQLLKQCRNRQEAA